MSKRRVSIVASLIACLAILTACSTNDPATSTTSVIPTPLASPTRIQIPLTADDKTRKQKRIKQLLQRPAAKETPSECPTPTGRFFNPKTGTIDGSRAFFILIEFKCRKPWQRLRLFIKPVNEAGGYRSSSGDPMVAGKLAMFTEPAFIARNKNTQVNVILAGCSMSGISAINNAFAQDMPNIPRGCSELGSYKALITVK